MLPHQTTDEDLGRQGIEIDAALNQYSESTDLTMSGGLTGSLVEAIDGWMHTEEAR